MYFCDIGEVVFDYVIFIGKLVVKINGNGWFDSFILVLQFIMVDVDVIDKFVVDIDGVVMDLLMVSEVDESLCYYEFFCVNGLVQMDYEDYLVMFGIKMVVIEEYWLELV